jgi:hypothetical protein
MLLKGVDRLLSFHYILYSVGGMAVLELEAIFPA